MPIFSKWNLPGLQVSFNCDLQSIRYLKTKPMFLGSFVGAIFSPPIFIYVVCYVCHDLDFDVIRRNSVLSSLRQRKFSAIQFLVILTASSPVLTAESDSLMVNVTINLAGICIEIEVYSQRWKIFPSGTHVDNT